MFPHKQTKVLIHLHFCTCYSNLMELIQNKSSHDYLQKLDEPTNVTQFSQKERKMIENIRTTTFEGYILRDKK